MEKWILCLHKGYVLNVIVPETSNKYKFHTGRPLLIKNNLDIDYFENEDNFEVVDAPEVHIDKVEEETQGAKDLPGVPNNITDEAKQADADSLVSGGEPIYSVEELKKLSKSKLRKILNKIASGKDSPTKISNIRKLILKIQGDK